MHLPHLIGPMQHYLWILKTTHSGADMDTSMEMAKGSLDDGLRWTIYDILRNRCPECLQLLLTSQCSWGCPAGATLMALRLQRAPIRHSQDIRGIRCMHVQE